MGLVDPPGPGPMRPAAVGRARAPAGRPARALAVRLREGRGLAEPRASRCVELILQPIPLPLQPIALPLQLLPRALSPCQLLAQPHDLLPEIVGRRVIGHRLLRHAIVMPDSRSWYKYEILDSSAEASLTR